MLQSHSGSVMKEVTLKLMTDETASILSIALAAGPVAESHTVRTHGQLPFPGFYL